MGGGGESGGEGVKGLEWWRVGVVVGESGGG